MHDFSLNLTQCTREYIAERLREQLSVYDTYPLVVADVGALFSEGQATAGEPVTASQIIAIGGGGGHPDHATDTRLAVAMVVEKAADAVNNAREQPIHSANASYIFGVRTGHDRAEAAILALAPTDALAEVKALLAERDAARSALMNAGIALHVAKRKAEAAEAEIAELNLNATARDVRIFELSEELDNAEAKVTRLVDAMERIKSRALWVRGNQSYREFPKYVLNAVRDALSDIKGDKP